jgi:ABC-2 type transport system ATP-binding protein
MPGLYVKLTAWENLLFFAGLYGLSRRRAAPLAERYLRLLGLWERRSDPVQAYSKGMRQRLAICRALLHQPRVVFLDEPTSGLDPEAARLVRESILELRSEGRTIFQSTHNMPEAEALCDLVGIFSTRLLRIDTMDEMRGGRHGVGTVVRVQGDAQKWLSSVLGLEFVLDASVSYAPSGGPLVGWNGLEDKDGQMESSELVVRLGDPYKYTPLLVQALAGHGAPILYVGPLLQTLESVYLDLLGRQEGNVLGEVYRAGDIPSIG